MNDNRAIILIRASLDAVVKAWDRWCQSQGCIMSATTHSTADADALLQPWITPSNRAFAVLSRDRRWCAFRENDRGGYIEVGTSGFLTFQLKTESVAMHASANSRRFEIQRSGESVAAVGYVKAERGWTYSAYGPIAELGLPMKRKIEASDIREAASRFGLRYWEEDFFEDKGVLLEWMRAQSLDTSILRRRLIEELQKAVPEAKFR